MRLKLGILSFVLLAGSFEPATAQVKVPAPPDPAMVKRLQGEIAQAEAKGDFQRAALELRILVGLYRNDPQMRSITYSQLAQVSTQLHDEAKAAEYRALAQGLPAHAAATPAFSPQAAAVSVSGPAAAPPFNPQVSAAPIPQTAGSTASGTDKLSKILAEAEQIMAQAKQVQQAMKQKASNTPQPNQPMPAQPDALPAAPDGMAAAPAPQPSLQAPADVSVAAGVVIGYDANNQPIFAPDQSTSAPPLSTQTTPTGDQSPPPQYPTPPK